MKVTLDRFEGEYAVCEASDRLMINISKEKIPAGAKVGDVLIVQGENISVDLRATQKRRRTIDSLMKKLW